MYKYKVFFIGVRIPVFERLLKMRIDLSHVVTIENSPLHSYLKEKKIDCILIKNKKELVELIKTREFDVLVSNGCPYILPISELKEKNKIFINVHPSLLPEFRGKHPVNGVLFFNKEHSGATCHFMDDGIDTGEIITQIKIDVNPSIDLGLLYKLLFLAEADAIEQAFKKNLKGNLRLNDDNQASEYKRTEKDMEIDLSNDTLEVIQSKVRAFSLKNQGAYFKYKNNKIKVLDTDLITSDFLETKLKEVKELQVMFLYENTLIIKKSDKMLKMTNLVGDYKMISEGEKLA